MPKLPNFALGNQNEFFYNMYYLYSTDIRPKYTGQNVKQRYVRMLTTEPLFYVQPNYTIEMFAQDLGTNRTYASRFCNDELGVSFSTLISRLRLARFIKMKQNRPHARNRELMSLCGFTNMYSFRRVFTATYGVSPSAYFKV